MAGPLILLALEEAFSYNPTQPRTPKGQKGAGQWSKGGVSTGTGHDLWAMNGFSYGATAAVAYLTGTKNYDTQFDSWEGAVGESMLRSIQAQKVRTTKGYSGHSGVPALEVGEVIDIPLMAITPDKKLASIYSGAPEPRSDHSVETVRSKIEETVRSVTQGMDESTSQVIREAFMEIEGKRFARADRFQPSTVYSFTSNKSTPIRPNERVTSGRYRVTAVEQAPIPGMVLWSERDKDFKPGHIQNVTLEFVEDLPIVNRLEE